MAESQAVNGRTEAENNAEEAAEAADGIQYPVLEVSMCRDSDFDLDPYCFKIECSGVDLADLYDGKWLTAYREYKVETIHAEDQATGVVVRIRHCPE